MARTRDYGSGSVTEVVPGEKYRLRVRTAPDVLTGTAGRVTETFHGTRKQAQARLAELVAENSRRRDATAATVEELVARYRKAAQLSEGTAANYDSAWRLMPARLRRTRATEVETEDLEHLYARLVADGASPHVVRHLHTMVRAAYNRGIKWRMFRFNPATLADVPSVNRRSIPLPSPDAVGRLVGAVTDDTRMALYLRLLLVTGQRRGEALALRWSDVDTGARTVSVSATVDKNGTVRHSTKNTKDRSTPLDDGTLALLDAWRHEQELLARTAGTVLVADPYVFSSDHDRTGATPTRGDVMYHRFKRHAAAAGIPDAHPHLLRHYFVTHALDAGVELGVVSKIVGHSRTAVTQDVYNRTVTGADRRAVDTIAAVTPVPPARRTASPFDDPTRLREAATAARSQSGALAALGLAPAAKNYARLRQRCGTLGIPLPGTPDDTR
jgi:integrase